MKEKEAVVSDWEILVHEDEERETEKNYFIEKCERHALRDKKNYQVLYSQAGGFQIWSDLPKFESDGCIPFNDALRYRLIYKTKYDFGEVAKEEAPEDDDAVSEALQVKEIIPEEKPKKKGRRKKDEIDEDE